MLAARVPDSVAGCDADGLDIETWARERLLDVLLLGTRTIHVDVASLPPRHSRRARPTHAQLRQLPCRRRRRHLQWVATSRSSPPLAASPPSQEGRTTILQLPRPAAPPPAERQHSHYAEAPGLGAGKPQPATVNPGALVRDLAAQQLTRLEFLVPTALLRRGENTIRPRRPLKSRTSNCTARKPAPTASPPASIRSAPPSPPPPPFAYTASDGIAPLPNP